MDSILDQIEKIVPQRYMPWVVLLVMLVPWFGRAYVALKNGHGIVGILRNILFGSAQPLAVEKQADAADTQHFTKAPPVAPFYTPTPGGPPPVPAVPPHPPILP